MYSFISLVGSCSFILCYHGEKVCKIRVSLVPSPLMAAILISHLLTLLKWRPEVAGDETIQENGNSE